MIILGTRLVGGRYETNGMVTEGLTMWLDAGNASSYPGSGTTWTDLSGSGNNAVLTGITPWTSAGDLSYFTFNNGAGYAQGGYFLPNTTYTKVAIFRVAGSYVNLISGDDSSQHAFWGGATAYLRAGHNGAWSTIVSPTITPTNQWVFGAVSFSSTSGWRLYLNGAVVATNGSTTQFAPNPARVQIGAYNGNGNNLNGDMSVALVYNRVLSDGEITQLYNFYLTRFGL